MCTPPLFHPRSSPGGSESWYRRIRPRMRCLTRRRRGDLRTGSVPGHGNPGRSSGEFTLSWESLPLLGVNKVLHQTSRCRMRRRLRADATDEGTPRAFAQCEDRTGRDFRVTHQDRLVCGSRLDAVVGATAVRTTVPSPPGTPAPTPCLDVGARNGGGSRETATQSGNLACIAQDNSFAVCMIMDRDSPYDNADARMSSNIR